MSDLAEQQASLADLFAQLLLVSIYQQAALLPPQPEAPSDIQQVLDSSPRR